MTKNCFGGSRITGLTFGSSMRSRGSSVLTTEHNVVKRLLAVSLRIKSSLKEETLVQGVAVPEAGADVG